MPNIRVFYDQPELSPNENRGYTGKTNEQGRYVLRPAGGEGTGVPPGTYRVSLSTASDPSAVAIPQPGNRQTTPFDPESPPPPPERVPPAYRGGKLSFTVPEDGTDAANFELKSR